MPTLTSGVFNSQFALYDSFQVACLDKVAEVTATWKRRGLGWLG